METHKLLVHHRKEEPEKTADELGLTDALLAEYRAGSLQPVRVRLPNVPADAPPLMRSVVEDFELVAGLRRATYDLEPVIYSCRWAADRIGAHYAAVSNVLRALVRLGALRDAGEMPARDGKRGTKLYDPGGAKT